MGRFLSVLMQILQFHIQNLRKSKLQSQKMEIFKGKNANNQVH